MKKKFGIYLKSYTDGPAFEQVITIGSHKAAVDHFMKQLESNGWDRKTVAKNTYEVEE